MFWTLTFAALFLITSIFALYLIFSQAQNDQFVKIELAAQHKADLRLRDKLIESLEEEIAYSERQITLMTRKIERMKTK